MTDCKLYLGDCSKVLSQIESESVDLTVTSPPYEKIRKYDGFVFDFESIAKHLFRVTKIGGVVVWVVSDQTSNGSESLTSFRQALFFRETGFNLHDTMIYEKENPIPQLKHTKRYTNSFDFMFVFSRGFPKTCNYITTPTKLAGRIDKNYRGQRLSNGIHDGEPIKVIKSEKILTNIWTYSQNNGIDRRIKHPAQFPEKLAGDHIISWSNDGDVVLDPMMGCGTTIKMALLLKRRAIGIEISEKYFNMARMRIDEYCSRDA